MAFQAKGAQKSEAGECSTKAEAKMESAAPDGEAPFPSQANRGAQNGVCKSPQGAPKKKSPM